MRGIKCQLNRNTASYDTPTWNALSKTRDVEIPGGRNMGENTSRAFDMVSVTPGPKKITLSTELVYKAGDTDLAALQTAFDNATVVDLCWVDEPGGAGAVGHRGDFYISKWDRKEPLEGSVMISVTFEATTDNGHGVVGYTYPGS